MQHDVISNDWKGTRDVVASQLMESNLTDGDFVVLSEMTDTGWSMDLDHITGIQTVEWACELANTYGVWIQVGWADRLETRGKNCVTICSPIGEPVATYTKVFTCNPFGENKHFDTGSELVIVDLGEIRLCPMICYDVRFPELWRLAVVSGVNIFTVSSSWPRSRISHWRAMLKSRAIENQAFVVATNRIGKDEIAAWGGSSMIVSPHGDILNEGNEIENHTVSSNIDPKIAQSWRNEFPVLQDIQEDLLGKITVREIIA
ncbi:MAG: nitrilase-related carbon-nitrogen hydrolase [Planctomycetota bacterium]|nr:nitrilase-related carbon-nitrogen hydrolase [Planctomycetota bacterium]